MFFRKKTKIRKPFFHRIINAFIYAGAGLIFILLIAFGFTQPALSENGSERLLLKR